MKKLAATFAPKKKNATNINGVNGNGEPGEGLDCEIEFSCEGNMYSFTRVRSPN